MYGTGIDVYAMGITMHDMMSHERPWSHVSGKTAIFRKVLQGERPPISPEVEAEAPTGKGGSWCSVMRECWHNSPQQRPSFEEIFRMLDTLLEEDAVKTEGADDVEGKLLSSSQERRGPLYLFRSFFLEGSSQEAASFINVNKDRRDSAMSANLLNEESLSWSEGSVKPLVGPQAICSDGD